MKVTTCDYCGKFPWTSRALDSNYYQSEDIFLMECGKCGSDYCDVCINDDFEMIEECCIADYKKRKESK